MLPREALDELPRPHGRRAERARSRGQLDVVRRYERARRRLRDHPDDDVVGGLVAAPAHCEAARAFRHDGAAVADAVEDDDDLGPGPHDSPQSRDERLRREVASLEANQEQMVSELKGLEGSVEKLTQAIHQEDLQILSVTKELDQYQIELKRLKQKIDTVRFEENELGAEWDAIQQQMQESEAQLQSQEAQKNEKESDLGRQEKDLQALKAEIEGILAVFTEARVQLSTLQEKRQSMAQNLERARRVQQETEALIRRHRREMEESLFIVKANEDQIQRGKAELQQFLVSHQDLQAHLEEKKQALLGEKGKIEQGEHTWKERRDILQNLVSRKNEFSMNLMEMELKLKHLLAGVEEKYRVNPQALLIEQDDQDYFAPEVEAHVQELKAQIESMGEVNLLAIEEYEESKARLDFLTEQERKTIESQSI